jgi:hypothetical protein
MFWKKKVFGHNAYIGKTPNSKTELKIKREIRAMKSLFSQKGNIS